MRRERYEHVIDLCRRRRGFRLRRGAQVVPDRATLQSIITGGTLEDFEALSMPFEGQRADFSGFLNSTTTFDGSGPGLVQPGVNYRANILWWNGDGYVGLNTRTLADSSVGGPITIEYTSAVTAMGIDLQTYAGYNLTGTISVYDTANNLLHTQAINGDSFFGYQNAGGIGSVVVASAGPDNSSYIMIDNHLFGVPTPGAAAALGLAGVSTLRRRRR
ncbi:MAG: hypothetical protein QM783_01505 [Phycisphaerales bacterium]